MGFQQKQQSNVSMQLPKKFSPSHVAIRVIIQYYGGTKTWHSLFSLNNKSNPTKKYHYRIPIHHSFERDSHEFVLQEYLKNFPFLDSINYKEAVANFFIKSLLRTFR